VLFLKEYIGKNLSYISLYKKSYALWRTTKEGFSFSNCYTEKRKSEGGCAVEILYSSDIFTNVFSFLFHAFSMYLINTKNSFLFC